jgi:hypothetical protein
MIKDQALLITWSSRARHSQALLRLQPERQLSQAEQVKAENLSVRETRQRVKEIIGKPLK